MAIRKRVRLKKTFDRETAPKTYLDPKLVLKPIATLRRSIRRSVRSAVRDEIASLRGKDWLSPQQPVGTFRPEGQSSGWRAWDFPPGYNTNTQPRKYEPYTFAQLRWLARNFDLLREVIERRKNEVAKLPWDIRARHGSSASDAEIAEVKEMLRYPDGETPFTSWQNALLEDMLVVDAPAVYPWPAMSGRVMKFVVIDGATINILIDEYGRVPDSPDPAYQQVIQGMPYEFFTRDELIYAPRNVRTGSPYGFSPVEQLVTSVAIALKLETRQLYYYSEGTIPDALVGVPESWSTGQLADFQAFWNETLAGNLHLRSGGVRFVPGGMKEVAIKDYKFDVEQWEWLARMICAAFHVNPQPYIRSNNRATAETAQVEQLQEGLEPTKIWWKALMDLIIERYLGKTNLEWVWNDTRDADVVEQANADASDIKSGIKAPNEVRAARGMDPYDGFGDEPIIVTGSGPMLLRSVYEGIGQTSGDVEPSKKASIMRKYNPDEPRLPAGQEGAGEWTTEDGALAAARSTAGSQHRPVQHDHHSESESEGKTKRGYVAAHYDDAKEAANLAQLPVTFMLGLTALEGGWPGQESRFVFDRNSNLPGNNYLGLQANEQRWYPYQTGSQAADKPRRPGRQPAMVATFASYHDCVMAFAKHPPEKIVNDAQARQDPTAFARALQGSGQFGWKDGKPVPSFVPDLVGVIRHLQPYVDEYERRRRKEESDQES